YLLNAFYLFLHLGGTCQSPALPALVRPPAPPLQPSLDIKPFLPFPLDTAAAVNLFPNFNAMDPIQKAVINHTFGVPLPHRRKQIISCNICQLRFNSDSQAAAHYKGTKHAKKLKALEAMKNKQKSVTTKDSAKTTFTSITTNTINTSSDKTGAIGYIWSANETHSRNNTFRPSWIILKWRSGGVGENSQSGKVLGIKKEDKKDKEIRKDV
ncbi:PREDICTED: zinc finger protein 385D-like, partial [Leptosomus discolor]|uniref:zinc finger protein 385D-like n=1 Tax=Leptosomus discolor TaxID=188344 RepID=UPI000522B591